MTDIKRGDLVVDFEGNKGVVVKVDIGFSIEEHGTVAVWQMDRYAYGADNCEHYCHFGWEKSLTIIEDK